MTPFGWFLIITSVLVGSVMGYAVFNRFPNLLNTKKEKEVNRIVNNPHLLVEKLNANGKMFEEGKGGMRAEINFKVGVGEKGQETVEMEKIETKKEPRKQSKKKEKVTKEKTKKKVKKKSKKKK